VLRGPFDADLRVVERETSFNVRVVVRPGLVDDIGHVAEYAEGVSESVRSVQLVVLDVVKAVEAGARQQQIARTRQYKRRERP
jgi:hypothetical protein